MKIAERIDRLPASATSRVLDRIAELRRGGRAVIDLAVGEPADAPPPEVIAAMTAALADGRTRYDATAGLMALREAIADRYPGCSAANVLITNGAKQGLYSLFQTILDPGDEVIVPHPCWVSFPRQVQLAGGAVRAVQVTLRTHRLDPKAIAEATGERTRALLINSPNNPTGAVCPAGELAEIARWCGERGIRLILDEAYSAFQYDEPPDGLLPCRDEIDAGRVVVRSFSKDFSMTGLRVGYVVASRSLIEAMSRLQSHQNGNVCTIAQYGALAALQIPPEWQAARRERYRRQRDLACRLAGRFFDLLPPAGGFYLFPDVSHHLKSGEGSAELAARLLDQATVAVVPGEAFGRPGHIRISYSVSENDLIRAFE